MAAPYFMAFVTKKYTGSGVLSKVFDPNSRFILENVRLTLNSTATTVEDFTCVLDSAEGVEYDVEIMTQPMGSVKTFRWCFGNENKFEKGDKLVFSYANSDSKTWGLEVRSMGMS